MLRDCPTVPPCRFGACFRRFHRSGQSGYRRSRRRSETPEWHARVGASIHIRALIERAVGKAHANVDQAARAVRDLSGSARRQNGLQPIRTRRGTGRRELDDRHRDRRRIDDGHIMRVSRHRRSRRQHRKYYHDAQGSHVALCGSTHGVRSLTEVRLNHNTASRFVFSAAGLLRFSVFFLTIRIGGASRPTGGKQRFRDEQTAGGRNACRTYKRDGGLGAKKMVCCD